MENTTKPSGVFFGGDSFQGLADFLRFRHTYEMRSLNEHDIG